MLRIRSLLKGALTFVPGAPALIPKPPPGSRADTPYYYGVWLKHLGGLAANGLDTSPTVVAELGPGDTLGVGLAALLCGAEKYYALDLLAYTQPKKNLAALDELVALLSKRTPRPDKGFPDFAYSRGGELFPTEVLTDERLARTLAPARLADIREALGSGSGRAGSIVVEYRAPWDDAAVIERDSVDLVVSQSVLEHVDDLETAYGALYQWLRPGGVMSHLIDLRSHGLTNEWNGHWSISDPMWTVMRGKRSFLINREPCSVHLEHMRRCGFEILYVAQRRGDATGIGRGRLAKRWQSLSDDDFSCNTVFIQARKPAQ
jgi:SAM-dependent methyltransferase